MADDTDDTSSECPHCGTDLAYERDGRTWYRTVLVEIPQVYDGGLFWLCPYCKGRWHRWPRKHYLRARAHRYVRDMDLEE